MQEGHKLELGQVVVPLTVTNAVSWRGPNINYRKNECFLDVIESVDVLVRFLRSAENITVTALIVYWLCSVADGAFGASSLSFLALLMHISQA